MKNKQKFYNIYYIFVDLFNFFHFQSTKKSRHLKYVIDILCLRKDIEEVNNLIRESGSTVRLEILPGAAARYKALMNN